MAPYIFTEDWFSMNIPVWQALTAPLAGRPCNALEIGSYQGLSAVWMLENMLTHADSKLTCIDTFEGSEEHSDVQKTRIFDLFEHNVLKNFPSKVVAHKGKSGKVLKTLGEEQYDFIYIDGAHYSANAMEDVVLSFPLLKVGGIMLFDDYGTGGQDDTKNPHIGIDGFVAAYAPFMSVIYRGYQIALVKTSRNEN